MKRQRTTNAGDLMKEIQEQDLMAPIGGLRDDGAQPNSGISCVTAVTALTAWSHDKITRKFGCGEALTLSAECNTTGNAC